MARRVGWAVATLVGQVIGAFVCGLLLSRVMRDDSSGWGDLIGFVVGLPIGAGIIATTALVLATRAASMRIRTRVVVGVVTIPAMVVCLSVLLGAGLSFWVAAAAIVIGVSAVAFSIVPARE